ncbi:hypothetical protein CEV33_4524 [Brucella grignonensis]|uniref:Uncharacterized protein n=1 Tax=Brucella grignonensis TaxID=94627 RepID=A0A256FNS4_9HYPH|nr:hypothetical protein CEV33_4524 [Brucella grignonensis]
MVAAVKALRAEQAQPEKLISDDISQFWPQFWPQFWHELSAIYES